MKKLKKPVIIFLTLVMILSLGGCGSSDSSGDEPLSLVGNWEPEVIGEDDYQAGFITEDSITIYWMSVSDSGMTSASLYWAGTYEAPTEDTDSYSWESVNDTEQTGSASQASDSETKTFTYEDGVLSYTVTVSDTTTLYELVMTDTDYSVYAGDADEIDSSEESDDDAEEETESTDDVAAEETDELESETSDSADADSESSEESDAAETSEDESIASGSVENEEYEQVELLDSGYSIYDKGNDRTQVYFAAEIYNPNENYAVDNSRLQITIRDEDGSIITTEDQLVGSIAAGDTFYFADNFYFQGTISSSATVEITVSNPTYDVYYTSQESSDVPYADELVISNTSLRSGSSYNYFTGEVTNNSSIDLSSVTVVVLFRLDGAIVGGEKTYLDDIAAGGTEAFEISSLIDFTGYDSYEIYAIPGL